MSINENGFFEGKEAESQHKFDKKLCQSLISFLKKENINEIVDFGCGMGSYVKEFIDNDIIAVGYDGNPNTPELTNNLCGILDLSKTILLENKFDWVMSLEVGEHIPKKYEDIFIENLHNNNKHGIILSWAVKGQGGHGHYNEQNNDYIKNKICNLGYINDIDNENFLRSNCSLPWFYKTIMVFKKN